MSTSSRLTEKFIVLLRPFQCAALHRISAICQYVIHGKTILPLGLFLLVKSTPGPVLLDRGTSVKRVHLSVEVAIGAPNNAYLASTSRVLEGESTALNVVDLERLTASDYGENLFLSLK